MVDAVLLVFVIVITTGAVAFFVFGVGFPEPSPVSRLSFKGLDDGDDTFYISNDGGVSLPA
ncbi:hypothetical protein AKJ64_03025 [candidate division MSBL1 archaeon SCGC-AAA259E17]|uniref:Archaeal Type IV pilin N-terminal domain-containing protein n=1 Tax=candidate division MSBL1 archaeon SCGC-AAA259E17 TaxID=1698263 RepID=A0A133UE68_9EURY|nr:hypothetical protein AKJ64_03025 [candidate division MSBL1 archaeon SCGC-AAA259E17]